MGAVSFRVSALCVALALGGCVAVPVPALPRSGQLSGGNTRADRAAINRIAREQTAVLHKRAAYVEAHPGGAYDAAVAAGDTVVGMPKAAVDAIWVACATVARSKVSETLRCGFPDPLLPNAPTYIKLSRDGRVTRIEGTPYAYTRTRGEPSS